MRKLVASVLVYVACATGAHAAAVTINLSAGQMFQGNGTEVPWGQVVNLAHAHDCGTARAGDSHAAGPAKAREEALAVRPRRKDDLPAIATVERMVKCPGRIRRALAEPCWERSPIQQFWRAIFTT